jgi:2-iminobutanoate/2-iminopropanoate deaminase
MAEPIISNSAPSPKGFYSQAVKASNLLFISGKLPATQDGNVSGSINLQTQQALSHVNAIVEAAGGSLADLVQCTVYIAEIRHWPEVTDAYAEFLPLIVPPVRAVVPVHELHHGALIEIQAVAHLGVA